MCIYLPFFDQFSVHIWCWLLSSLLHLSCLSLLHGVDMWGQTIISDLPCWILSLVFSSLIHASADCWPYFKYRGGHATTVWLWALMKTSEVRTCWLFEWSSCKGFWSIFFLIVTFLMHRASDLLFVWLFFNGVLTFCCGINKIQLTSCSVVYS